LAFSDVRAVLRSQCRARCIVVVLDCCFAGHASASPRGTLDDAFDLASIEGSYLLTSTAGEEHALAAPGERHTAFSGALLRFLSEGDPTAPTAATIEHAYRYLARVLPLQGAPRPRRQAGDGAGDLILAPNPANRSRRPAPRRPSATSADTCPYRGLETFGADDARFFFGRESLTANLQRRLAERIQAPGPLVVVGPSGAGKSSLLRAGLVPAIARDGLGVAGSRRWPCVVFTPGADPVGALAVRLAHGASATTTEVRAAIEADPARIREFVRRASRTPGGTDTGGDRQILVVDQFEELFTHCTDERQRSIFISALLAAAEPLVERPDVSMALVVLGIRADFYGHCAIYPELVPALQEALVVVGPMSADEIRDAIEKPASVAGLVLEPGLADILLRDLGSHPADEQPHHEPGPLPLLSHALLQTWQQRHGNALTVDGYRATGGIWKAVARTAEATYAGLDASDQVVAQRLLLRLVRIGDGTEDTRRSVSLTDLAPAAVDRVLDDFARARLVTVDENTVQLAHEALLRAWPRLRTWIDEDRARLLVGQHLREAAEAWDRGSLDPAYLLRGARLAASREWAASAHGDNMSTVAREFLQASIELELAEQRATRRRTRRLYRLVAALTTLLLVSALLSYYALQQRSYANRLRVEGLARLVAAEADRMRATDVSLAAQLSLAAYGIAPSVETRSTLLESSAAPSVTRIRGPAGVMQSVVVDPAGHFLAAGAADDTVRLWGFSDHRQLAVLGTPRTGPESYVFSLAFSPDGHIVAAGDDRNVRIWNVADPRRPVTLGSLPPGPTSTIYSLAYSPDGRTIAAASFDKTIWLWNITDPAHPSILTPPLRGFTAAVQSVAFSPDGHTLAAGGADATVRLWDMTNPGQPTPLGQPLTGPAKTVFSVTFSPDGRTLAAGSADANVWQWDVSNRGSPSPVGPPLSTDNWVNSVAFSPDGQTLAAGGSDNTVRLWNVSTKRLSASLPHPDPVTAVSFTHDGRSLATAAADGVARVWQIPDPVLTGPTDRVFTVAFSPDGQTLAGAAGSGDNAVHLWNTSDPWHPTALPTAVTSPTTPGHQSGATAFAPSGRILAVGCVDGTVQLWDLADLQHPVMLTPPLAGPKAVVESVAFSPDGRTLAVGGDDDTVQLWDLTDPTRTHPLPTLHGPAGYVFSVAFSPDGRTLAAASADKRVWLWNVTHLSWPSSLGTPLTGFDSYAYAVAFTPDSRVLAAGSADRTIRMWNVTRPDRPTLLSTMANGAGGYVDGLAFSPDGRTLAAAKTDSTVWLWDTAKANQPQELATLTSPKDQVLTLAFRPTGHTLAAGIGKTIQLWDTDLDLVAAHICAAAGDPITPEEWSQYIPVQPYNPPCR